MTHSTAGLSLAARGAVAVALALAATGCGSGRDAQTYAPRVPADFSNANAGNIALRGVSVKPPTGEGAIYRAGDDARVGFTFVSEDAEADRLIEVTTDVASSVALVADGQPGDVAVPAQGATGSEASIILLGLTRELRPGQYVEMTFTFERNGSTKVLVPVASAAYPRPEKSEGEEEGGH
ncbi:MAG TPA: hypothetical protein VNA30_06855 [Mycobacteriales bacterium]|nr:hypothetical protein [Mycobacteriales bacterium]